MMSPTHLTILHCIAPAPFGGLESVVRMLAKGHHTRGHRVVIAAVVDTPHHPFVETLKNDGLEVVALQIASRDYRKERQDIARLITSVRPHVVHAHGYRSDILDLAVARKHKVPTVTTLHGFTGGDWKLRLYERLQLRAVRYVDAVVAVSRNVYDRLATTGVSKDRLHLVPNAYAIPTNLPTRDDVRQTLDIPEEDVRLGWIGRLSYEKGPDVAIDALAAVADPSVTLSVVGDGPDRDALLVQADTLHLEDRIVMHGALPNAGQLLPAFDLFVLSSRTEGTPITVLEAMAAHTPIVATAVGGVPDMLSNDEAWLVQPEQPEALAAAINDAIRNPADAHARATRARERLERDFNVETWLTQYESIYQSIQ
jgi:glycosyltransferase involved in cell wall biosynthesis